MKVLSDFEVKELIRLLILLNYYTSRYENTLNEDANKMMMQLLSDL